MSTAAAAPRPDLPPGMDPAYYALSLLRRRRLAESVAVSTYYLQHSPKPTTAATTTTTAAAAAAAAGGSSVGSSSSSAAGHEVAALDEQLWVIQTKAMVLQSWYDDAEIDDDGMDQVLMEGEEAVVSTAHKPSTSMQAAAARNTTAGRLTARATSRSGARASRAGLGTGGRPVSSRYGFARPGTLGNRPGSVAGRGGTAQQRPITGRLVRLGTASLMAVPGGPHVDVQHLKLDKVARERPMVAKLLCDYLLFVEHLPKLALELCTAALRVGATTAANQTAAGGGARPGLPLAPGGGPGLPLAVDRTQPQVGVANAEDWWWKARLAKANYQLGLLREAERYYKAALFEGENSTSKNTNSNNNNSMNRFQHYNTSTIMELAKVYKRMDQPITACELFAEALEANPVDHQILLCSARLYDELHDSQRAFEFYTSILRVDSSCVEAIACTAAFFFYEKNQPELALRFYRRLLQMGVQSCEVWNNMGLCAFFTSQFDFALSCLERALTMATEPSERADIYYNIGHVGVGLGDLVFAQRGFRLAVAADPTHGEALNNLAVLALQQEQTELAAAAAAHKSNTTKSAEDFHQEGAQLLEMAKAAAPELPEALYNCALLAYQQGELEVAHELLSRALDVFPDHAESAQLIDRIMKHLGAL